jgi:hypothetical protein
MRSASRCWIGILCCLPAAPLWAGAAVDSARPLLDSLRRGAAPAPEGGEFRARWEALAGTGPLSIPCATPVLLSLRQARPTLPPASQEALDRLLEPPRPTRRLGSVDGFEVRAARSLRLPPSAAGSGGSDLPGALESALDEAGRALRQWSEAAGWNPPAESAQGRPLPILLADLPAGVESVSLIESEPERTFEEDATASIMVHPRLLDDPERLARALVHQSAHALLWAYSHREPPAWQEATAVALEVLALRSALPHADLFSERLQARSVSLRDEGLRSARGGGVWALFLELSRPPGSDSTLRRLWEELGAVGGDNLTEAAERLLAGADGSGPAEEIATFLAWGLFTGERDDGRHLPFAAALRSPGEDGLHSVYPASGPTERRALPPWSGAVYRFEGGGEPGGLRIEFQGEEHGRWAVLALLEGRDRALRSTWLEADGEGSRRLGVPWRAVSAVTLIVANAAPPGQEEATFSYSAWLDPAYPFELTELRAEAGREGVLLAWSTDAETDLAGWNVLRAAAPLGVFVRVNRLPIPGGGESEEPLHYLFLDSETERGRKYYYRLEALTAGGLSESTPAVSVRVPAEPGGR